MKQHIRSKILNTSLNRNAKTIYGNAVRYHSTTTTQQRQQTLTLRAGTFIIFCNFVLLIKCNLLRSAGRYSKTTVQISQQQQRQQKVREKGLTRAELFGGDRQMNYHVDEQQTKAKVTLDIFVIGKLLFAAISWEHLFTTLDSKKLSLTSSISAHRHTH